MSDWKAKRFWKTASVSAIDDGFTVKLDDRPVKTPAKSNFILPTFAFAEIVAEEWNAQKELIDPTSMPATRTANAAIDKVSTQKAEVAEMLAAYGDSDLLCYRAEAPTKLVERQRASWDPILDWAESALNVRLKTRTGVMHQPQRPEEIAKLRAKVFELDAFKLSAFHDLVSLSGSLILAFATTEQFEQPQQAWDASRIDETWQAEQWGVDDEAASLAAQKRVSFLNAALFFHAFDQKN